MASAKDLVVKPISSKTARALITRLHYSKKVVNNSQLHFGVFWNGSLEGCMQFGPSLDKRKIQGLVKGTPWNGFIELNRMAFSEKLPRNSESRAISVALRIMKKAYPHIEWVISFSDACQCGDGAIYRASGFVLTDIKVNKHLRTNPETDEVMHRIQAHHLMRRDFKNWAPAQGYQLRYISFQNKDARERLTVPIIPFSRIAETGASMYKGEKITRCKQATSSAQLDSGGASPTTPLQAK